MGTEKEEKNLKRKEKAKKRRNDKPYVYLDKSENLRLRQDYMDVDYIDGVKNEKGETVIRALTHEEKEWLNNFYKEDLNASISKKNPIFYKENEQRLESFGRNNQRNRCLYNRQKASGALIELEDGISQHNPVKKTLSPEEICQRKEKEEYEDSLIDKYGPIKKAKKS